MSAYHTALDTLERVAVRDAAIAADACRSLVLTHGLRSGRATLFLHGMCASPRQFAVLASFVHAAGDNVYVPRLPRHGYPDRLTASLRSLRAEELLAHAEQSLSVAHGLGKTVRVVGFSLGGLLAAWIAQHHLIDEAIAISPLLGIAAVPPQRTQSLARILRRLPNGFFWWDPIQRANLMPAHGYPRCATHALAESLTIAGDLLSTARTCKPRSRIVLVTNAGECAVNNRAVADLARLWQANRPGFVEQRLIAGLGRSHDIIEPLRKNAKVDKSYPVLQALLERTRYS